MSLSIDIDRVSRVLLADGWHEVLKFSFDLDSYEFVQSDEEDQEFGLHQRNSEPHVLLAGGRVQGVPATGATWREADGSRICCPITAVLAVKVVTREHKTEVAGEVVVSEVNCND